MKSITLILIVSVFSANSGVFGKSTPSTCRGKSVPRDKCAVLYDDADCGGWQVKTWQPCKPFISTAGLLDFDVQFAQRINSKPAPFLQHVVPVGYSELSIMRRNDAESLIVRPGCKFVGELISKAVCPSFFCSKCGVNFWGQMAVPVLCDIPSGLANVLLPLRL